MKKNPTVFKNKLEVDRTGVEFQRFNVPLGDTNQFHILIIFYRPRKKPLPGGDNINIYIYRNPISSMMSMGYGIFNLHLG